jgi:phosphoglycerate dehydrogenase-like enzyme
MQTLNVILHFDIDPERPELKLLSALGIEVAVCPEADEGRLAGLLPTADVIWHVLKPLTAAMIAAAPRLKLIQKIGVGVNTIDLATAQARGIAVCNMPGTNSRAVAEMTLLLMLAALRRLPLLDRRTRAGEGWSLSAAALSGFGEIGGRTIGFVGHGAVPRILAPIVQAMGADIIYAARNPKADALGRHRSLESLLAEADIISLHVPLTAQTEGMIGPAEFARMKRGAILINTARGSLVREPALVAALRSGQLAAAGLDVFASEPVSPENPLLGLDNVVLAPHLAWLTEGTLGRSIAVARENCLRLRAGTALLHRVV